MSVLSGRTASVTCAQDNNAPSPQTRHRRPIRMLRLPQVVDATGLGKTKIYELQAEGTFPMRVKITSHSVAWIEEEVQAWLAARVQTQAVGNSGKCKPC
jgi:prophage regulatory protein